MLDILNADSLQKNALEVGNYWRDELLALQRRFSVMADVRGHGIFIGVEFLNDDHTPATELVQNIKNKMKEHSTSPRARHRRFRSVPDERCLIQGFAQRTGVWSW